MDIVIADPDATERKQLKDAVKLAAASLSSSTRVHEASRGVEAWELCRQHRPGLVLCEILLEGMSGLALLRRLRGLEAPANTSVVFVTAMSRDTDRYWALRNGAHAFIAKPYDPQTLRKRICEILEGAAPERPR